MVRVETRGRAEKRRDDEGGRGDKRRERERGREEKEKGTGKREGEGETRRELTNPTARRGNHKDAIHHVAFHICRPVSPPRPSTDCLPILFSSTLAYRLSGHFLSPFRPYKFLSFPIGCKNFNDKKSVTCLWIHRLTLVLPAQGTQTLHPSPSIGDKRTKTSQACTPVM